MQWHSDKYPDKGYKSTQDMEAGNFDGFDTKDLVAGNHRPGVYYTGCECGWVPYPTNSKPNYPPRCPQCDTTSTIAPICGAGYTPQVKPYWLYCMNQKCKEPNGHHTLLKRSWDSASWNNPS